MRGVLRAGDSGGGSVVAGVVVVAALSSRVSVAQRHRHMLA